MRPFQLLWKWRRTLAAHSWAKVAARIFTILAAAVVILLILLAVRAYDRVGDLSPQVHQTLAAAHASYTPLAQISPWAQEGLIASQDKRFYSNPGVDIIATARAVGMSLLTGQRQGASTITEQLAKNVYYQDVDSLQTDVESKFLALFITLRYSKRTILELYFNEVIYGPRARGIGQASAVYFDLAPQQLSLTQSAYLIGLLNAPGYFASHLEAAKAEAEVVLGTMNRDGYLTPSQFATAQAEVGSIELAGSAGMP